MQTSIGHISLDGADTMLHLLQHLPVNIGSTNFIISDTLLRQDT